MEVSNNGLEWIEVDRHENEKFKSVSKAYHCWKECSLLKYHKGYSKFKVPQLGRNCAGQDRLEIGGFPIFGSIDYTT